MFANPSDEHGSPAAVRSPETSDCADEVVEWDVEVLEQIGEPYDSVRSIGISGLFDAPALLAADGHGVKPVRVIFCVPVCLPPQGTSGGGLKGVIAVTTHDVVNGERGR